MKCLGAPRSTENQPGSASDNPGSTSNYKRAVWEKQHLVWDHSWGAWKSLLLLVIQWFLKLMYSVCILIYESMYQYCFPSTHDILVLRAQFAEELLDTWRTIKLEWTQIYTLRRLFSGLADALGGCNWASLEMPQEAEIEWTQMQFEAVVGWASRCTWSPRSSELRDALDGCDRVSLVIHWDAMIECTLRCT